MRQTRHPLLMILAAVTAALTSCTSDSANTDLPIALSDDTSGSITMRDTSSSSPARSGTGAQQLSPCWTAPPRRSSEIEEPRYEDVTADAGLVSPLLGMYGHASAAADVDRDGWTDLFVGTFADRPSEDYRTRGADGPSPDRLLLGGPDGFRVDDSFPTQFARTSGATFADLDDDGDLDLVVARNPRDGDERRTTPSTIYEQTPDGWRMATSLAADVGGRSVATVDVDGDGMLDLAIAGDRFGAGPTRLYRNEGDLQFADATEAWGVPTDIETLALATTDLDGDGRVDLIASGDRRVLLGTGSGFHVVEVPEFEWTTYGEEDDAAGISVGDLDADGRPDLVVGQHFNSTLDDDRHVPIRIFLNRSQDGDVRFDDVTAEAAVPGFPTKSPHVDVADIDNDADLDIITSALTANGAPIVLLNTGADPLRFEATGEAGTDYWVTGVSEDFDQDGVLDIFAVAWEPATPSTLFRGVHDAGHWVEVDVEHLGASAVGATVTATIAGRSTVTWIAATDGYAAGTPARARFGLGDAEPSTVHIDVTTLDGESWSFDIPVDVSAAIGDCATS